MKQLTIRGVDDDLNGALQNGAKQRGTSINRHVLALLKDAVGLVHRKEEPVEYHDLDHLAGTWTQEEYEEFERQLLENRNIEEDLWR